MDCVNGTLVNHRLLTSRTWDWTSLRNFLVMETSKSMVTRQEVLAAPHTSKLVIFDRTKVRACLWIYESEVSTRYLMEHYFLFVGKHQTVIFG